MLKPLTVRITINWKILKEIGLLDHFACLLRNLYAGQEATVRTRPGRTDWFKIGKGVCQSCILSPSCLNSMQSTSCKMLSWMNHRLESRLLVEISTTSDMDFPDSSVSKESTCNVGDPGSIPRSGRYCGEGKGYPCQYSGLENYMDCVVSPWGCKKSDTTEPLSLSQPLFPVIVTMGLGLQHLHVGRARTFSLYQLWVF